MKMKNVLGVLNSKSVQCPIPCQFSIFYFSPSNFRSLHQALKRATPLFPWMKLWKRCLWAKGKVTSLHFDTYNFQFSLLWHFQQVNNVLSCRILLSKTCHFRYSHNYYFTTGGVVIVKIMALLNKWKDQPIFLFVSPPYSKVTLVPTK